MTYPFSVILIYFFLLDYFSFNKHLLTLLKFYWKYKDEGRNRGTFTRNKDKNASQNDSNSHFWYMTIKCTISLRR